jgi:glutaredoxin
VSVNENVKTAVLYGKQNCPNCANAKNLLKKNNYEITYINLDDEQERKTFYEKVSIEVDGTVTTVPQIWISQKYIGGYNALVDYLNAENSINFDSEF